MGRLPTYCTPYNIHRIDTPQPDDKRGCVHRGFEDCSRRTYVPRQTTRRSCPKKTGFGTTALACGRKPVPNMGTAVPYTCSDGRNTNHTPRRTSIMCFTALSSLPLVGTGFDACFAFGATKKNVPRYLLLFFWSTIFEILKFLKIHVIYCGTPLFWADKK